MLPFVVKKEYQWSETFSYCYFCVSLNVVLCVRGCVTGTKDEPGSHIVALGTQSHLKRFVGCSADAYVCVHELVIAVISFYTVNRSYQ